MNIFLFLALGIAVSTVFFVIDVFRRRPKSYRERVAEGEAMPSPPIGDFGLRLLRLAPIDYMYLVCVGVIPLGVLIEEHLYWGLYVWAAFLIPLLAIVIRAKNKVPKAISKISFSPASFHVQYCGSKTTRSFPYDAVAGYAVNLVNQSVRKSDRNGRGYEVGISLFDRSEVVVALIPSDLRGYGLIRDWVKARYPQLGEIVPRFTPTEPGPSSGKGTES